MACSPKVSLESIVCPSRRSFVLDIAKQVSSMLLSLAPLWLGLFSPLRRLLILEHQFTAFRLCFLSLSQPCAKNSDKCASWQPLRFLVLMLWS